MHRLARLAFALVEVCPATLLARSPLPVDFDPWPEPEIKRPIEPAGGPCATVPLPGEDCGNAIGIGTLPFSASGTTCDYQDDYAPPCCQLPGAPDAVYVFVPSRDLCVDVDLCGAAYDSAVHVFEDGPGHSIACNDDGCGYASQLSHFELTGGRTYYFVVDGWSTGCGGYTLEIRECPPPCPLPEASGALPEGEPVCADGYYDRWNMGCNDFPYVFTVLPCLADGVVVRGTYGTWLYYQDEFRDTDWYQIDLPESTAVELSVQGGAATQVAILDGRRGCGEWEVVAGSAFGEACEPVSCSAMVGPGRYWLFVAPRAYTGVMCGTPYVLALDVQSCRVVGLRADTWSAAKQRFQ